MKKRFKHIAAITVFFVLLMGLLTGCVKEPKQPPPKEKPKAKAPKTQETDVVVIGAGGAGLAAALAAAEEGAKVIVLEKMSIVGGNTLRSGGAYNAVDPELQKPAGIEDSIDKHYEQTLQGGDNLAEPKLVRVLVEGSPKGLKWLKDHGMKFQDKISSVVGSLWPRTHQAVDPAGSGYINTLKNACEKKGVKIHLDTKATELIKDDDGKVAGVKAQDKDKNNLEFKARKGVVIASGGFSANVDMRSKYNPKLTKEFPTTNHPGATGDGITMGEKVNADLVGMKYIQLIPIATKSGTIQKGVTINIDNVAFINKDGKRFINEDNRRDKLSDAILKQPEGMYFMVNDSKIVKDVNEYGEKIEELIKGKSVFKADTLKELAEQIDVPAETLEKTIDEFNKNVDAKKDEFGRKVWKNKIDKAPFYATPRCPAVHHTMGGLKINEKAQVINKDDKVIPGLYAAGEVTGGIHGSNRLGGNALPDIIVFGRIAGENIAKE